MSARPRKRGEGGFRRCNGTEETLAVVSLSPFFMGRGRGEGRAIVLKYWKRHTGRRSRDGTESKRWKTV
jgi:hypothetical protein